LLYRAVATPELKQQMTAIGFETAAVPPEELAARIKADMPKWAKLISDAKIRP
jgi:tripartite-type tricarboxylate transporter receptor subunit TctC